MSNQQSRCPPFPPINENPWWWMIVSVINGQYRLTVWVTNPGANGRWRLSKGVGLDCLEGEGLSVHTHWSPELKTIKMFKTKEGKKVKLIWNRRKVTQYAEHLWGSMVVYPTWEGGEVEKEVVQTSCESWNPANAPLSSSSGALDKQTHLFSSVYILLSGVLSCLLSKASTFP